MSRHGQPTVMARRHWEWAGWRREQLTRAGFDDVSAARIAAEYAMDLHQVLDLVARGCPPPLAARILAPLADNDQQDVP